MEISRHLLINQDNSGHLKDLTEELAVGRDDGRSDFGPGRSRVGGIYGSGPGKPKKGRAAPRDPKRIRHSSELDLDYEDDPDMM
ncbi:hypothetical protein CK203_008830 [Vitis vinifera]|uniref:Uncharacterized protein n=1 Tax=Vitis vinifera TaxID=29760 RepID=A0A438KDF8_VITVI|nr:hypothetical protein CK203_008830 [Vitis vinifera]